MDKRTHAEYNDFNQKRIAKRWSKKDANSKGGYRVHSFQRRRSDRKFLLDRKTEDRNLGYANSAQKIEEMKQHAARRSARNDCPRDVEHHSAVEMKEEREDKEPLSRRSFLRIRQNITKADSIWFRIDTARSSSPKEMRGEEVSWNDRQGEATQIFAGISLHRASCRGTCKNAKFSPCTDVLICNK
jgi:hypothetical protein